MAFIRPNLDSVTTIRADGSRFFLHPADAQGRFTTWRRLAAALLVAVYVLLPWIPVGGYPAVFLDVGARRFHFFGFTLAAQDLWLFFFLVTGLGFALFYVTSLLGRVWCGWACPQTVFLEHVFRRLERAIEGDAVARRRLDAAPWTAGKAARRVLKHSLFVLLSAAIAHVFLAYFVSLPAVYQMVTHAPARNWGAFVFMAAATGILYFNFAWFREQLCIVICPYGRLQSALIDDHSLVIGYDNGRGEPRGRGEGAGDCIDCARCVQVCPTGIDIRQGLQMECIGCAACIDACDDVMDRLGRRRGLVRYDSLSGLAGGRTRWLRPRTVVYTVLLLVGAAVMAAAFSTVRPGLVQPARMTGSAYYLDAGAVRNQFLVRFTNKGALPTRFIARVEGGPAGLEVNGLEGGVPVAPMAEEVRPLVLRVPQQAYAGPFRLRLVVRDEQGGYDIAKELEFTGPDPRLLREAPASP